MTCLLCHFIRPDVERDIWMHFCSLHIQRHENSNAIWQCIDIECNVSRYVRICAHYVENSMSHKWLSLHIYTVPHPACEKEKRDREKECVLETPWILETRIDLVRLMNIDEPFPTYLPDRTSTFVTRQRSSSFLSLLYIFSQINFSKPLRHLVKPFFQFLRSFTFLSIQ